MVQKLWRDSKIVGFLLVKRGYLKGLFTVFNVSAPVGISTRSWSYFVFIFTLAYVVILQYSCKYSC